MIEIKAMVKPFKIEKITNITDAAYLIRFSKNDINFKSGQHLVAGMSNSKDYREYSIYSGENDPYLEILVREVENGDISKKLHELTSGEKMEIKGPYGFFMHNAQNTINKKFLFISSGTGIAPFHSFVKTHPESDYQIIHGIRNREEEYGKKNYKEGRYISCTSKDKKGNYAGRLTDYLKKADIDKDRHIYLCGNSEMIIDAMEILENRGFLPSQMYTEVYF